MERFLDAGQIVNTHGVRGEMRVAPWCDSAEFLTGFKTFYIDGKPQKVRSSRVHKENLLLTLEGVDDINAAMPLKNKIIKIDREDAALPPDTHFIADLIGLEARNAATGEVLGELKEVMPLPANDVYVVRGQREYLIPAVSAFIAETNIEGGYILVKMQKGLATDDED